MTGIDKFPDVPPLLSSIKSSADLKALSTVQLHTLCREIRTYLIEAVSRTGGHLGPNLGVVELTVALHIAFNLPSDTLIFDTGHQAYVHKLLTGRQDFSTLRKEGGLSGYPSRAESQCDIVENSHASTALSWAYGISKAKQLQGDESFTVALIGDGAMTGGMAWEALNNIATEGTKRLVVVVNDNGRSYAPTIGGLSRHLNSIRVDPRYEKALDNISRILLSTGRPGEAALETLKSVKRGLKEVIAPQVMFEDLGLKYLGPIDGHDIDQLTETFRQIRDFQAPVIVHVKTEKGRGYTPAEQDKADRFHAVGVIHPETGLPVAPSRFGWTAVFADEMLKLANKREDLVGVTAAMTLPVGLGPMAKQFPERVLDVGIAEANAATVCAGMAYAGMHPVFAVYSTFLNRAFDQVLMDCALHRAGVTFVLDRSGVTGDDGASHNGVWDIALMSIVPSLHLAAPRDAATLRQSLRIAVDISDAPSVIRYPKGGAPEDFEVEGHSADGMFDWIRRNSQRSPVLIIGVGSLLGECVEACEILQSRGIAADLCNPIWLLPISQELISAASGYDLVLVIEDGLKDCGYGAAIRSALSRTATRVQTMGLAKKFWEHQSRPSLLEKNNLTAEGIARVAAASMGESSD